MNFGKFFRSFSTGFAGLFQAARAEQNLRIHLVAAGGVGIAGVWFGLAAWEWVAVLLCIGGVISAECMNSAIERLADRVTMERDPMIKLAKDYGSAGVLVMALVSAAVGVVIFGPKCWHALGR